MADVDVVFEGWNSVTQSWGGGGWGEDVSFTGITSSVGSVTLVEGSGVTVTVTGLVATSAVGSVIIGEGVGVAVTGNSVTVSSGGVNVWSLVDTSQTPNWTEISTSQTPSWTDIAA